MVLVTIVIVVTVVVAIITVTAIVTVTAITIVIVASCCARFLRELFPFCIWTQFLLVKAVLIEGS